MTVNYAPLIQMISSRCTAWFGFCVTVFEMLLDGQLSDVFFYLFPRLSGLAYHSRSTSVEPNIGA